MSRKAPPPTSQKQAVDQTAQDYWTSYFGPYGVTWVKEIKRRVKAALETAIRRASKNAEAPQFVQSRLVEKAAAVIRDSEGRITAFKVEGFYRGTTKGGVIDRRIVSATFSPDGRMTGLDHISV